MPRAPQAPEAARPEGKAGVGEQLATPFADEAQPFSLKTRPLPAWQIVFRRLIPTRRLTRSSREADSHPTTAGDLTASYRTPAT